jgi:hypothetical protein
VRALSRKTMRSDRDALFTAARSFRPTRSSRALLPTSAVPPGPRSARPRGAPRRRPDGSRLVALEESVQLDLGLLKDAAQKNEHRKRRAVRVRFAWPAALRRALERGRKLISLTSREHAGFEIERVAVRRHARRPPGAGGLGFARCDGTTGASRPARACAASADEPCRPRQTADSGRDVLDRPRQAFTGLHRSRDQNRSRECRASSITRRT